MSLLVDYEISDEEECDGDDVNNGETIQTIAPIKNESLGEVTSLQLPLPPKSSKTSADSSAHTTYQTNDQLITFKSIPEPKNVDEEEEAEMIILPSAKELELREKPPQNKKHRIVVSLPVIENSDSEDEGKEKMIGPPTKKRKGASELLNMLPKPKFHPTKEANRPLIPHTLSKKNQNPAEASAPTSSMAFISKAKELNGDQSGSKSLKTDFIGLRGLASGEDVSDEDDGANSFTRGSIHGFSTQPEDDGGEANYLMPSCSVSSLPHMSSLYRYRDDDDDAAAGADDAAQYYQHNESELSQQAQEDQLFNERLAKLMGKQKGQDSNIEVIDVKLSEHLSKYEVERMKELTREMTVSSHGARKGPGMPTSQQKRKHQITYLAQQAKDRELDLKNQWSENRFNRRQTQSKYGF